MLCLFWPPGTDSRSIHFHISAQPILALVAGLLILIRPKLLNFVVAAYLVVVGLFGLFNLPW